MGLAGVILAAGESTRMGRDKALLRWPLESGQTPSTLLSHAIATLSNVCDFVIVIVGKNEAALAPVIYSHGAFLARNPEPERGQFSSLKTGLQEVLNRGHDTAMVTLVDRPAPAVATLEGLVSEFDSRSHAVWSVVPEYGGKHGHPIVVARELIEEFLKAPATANARDLEHANQVHITYLPVNDPLVTTNINTPEDYASLQSKA